MQKLSKNPTHPLAVRLARLLALVGLILVAVQILLQAMESGGICFNDSCKVVEQNTRIAPLFINLTGLAFFGLVALLLRFSSRSQGGGRRLLESLLLAAVAAEGVLFSFQHFVLEAYCSYCLLVLCLILLLNLLACGFAHFVRAGGVFFMVLIVFSVLNFTSTGPATSLDQGTMAVRDGDKDGNQAYLVFSSTCTHCERTLDAIRQTPGRTIHFNPIDNIDTLDIKGLQYRDAYVPEVNLRLLATLGIAEVPVLITRQGGSMRITTGETAIVNLITGKAEQASPSSTEVGLSAGEDTAGQSTDDGCAVSEDCADTPVIPGLP